MSGFLPDDPTVGWGIGPQDGAWGQGEGVRWKVENENSYLAEGRLETLSYLGYKHQTEHAQEKSHYTKVAKASVM